MSPFKQFYKKFLKPDDIGEWLILLVLITVCVCFVLWIFVFSGFSR